MNETEYKVLPKSTFVVLVTIPILMGFCLAMVLALMVMQHQDKKNAEPCIKNDAPFISGRITESQYELEGC